LQELLVDYWRPLYAFLRYQGHDPDAAMDAVQGYLLHLLERDFGSSLDATRGKFRSYLLAGLKNYLTNEHEKALASRRGGGLRVLPLDAAHATRSYEPVSPEEPPEKIFEREWAICILERALAALKKEFVESGRAELFEALCRFFRPAEEP